MATATLIASLSEAPAPCVMDDKEYIRASGSIPGDPAVTVIVRAAATTAPAKALAEMPAGSRVIVSGPVQLVEDGALPLVTALVVCPATEEQFLNEVTIVGRVGGEPRTAESGKSSKRSVAVNRYRRDPSTEEIIEETDWFGVRAFGFTKDKLEKVDTGALVQVYGAFTQLTNSKGEPYCELKARGIVRHKGNKGGSNPAKGTKAAGYDQASFEGSADDLSTDWD